MGAGKGSRTSQPIGHGIAVVARRTGISQLLLRAWERRYGAVEPRRTPTGRRFYSDQDIAKLRLLRQLTDAGHRIGDVAHLSVARLEELAKDLPTPAAPAPRNAPPDDLLGAALDAIAGMDSRRLQAILQQSAVALSRPVLRRDLIEPLLAEIGERWQDGRFRVAHEHMATHIVRTFLSNLRPQRDDAVGAPLMVAATPSGHRHELGALLATSQAEEAGWNVSFLGADIPAEEIAALALQKGARLVLLSLIYPGHDPATRTQLRALRQAVGDETAIVAGGGAAASYADVLDEIGAHLVADTGELDRILRRLS